MAAAVVQMHEAKIESECKSDFDRLQRYFDKRKVKKVAIYSHMCADPDALASAIGIKFLLKNFFSIEDVDYYCSGEVSHPQNKAMVQLLDIKLNPVEDAPKKDETTLNLLVDTIPANAGVSTPTTFDIVIDHHKEVPNGSFSGFLIHHHTGSCSGIVYELIKDSGTELSDEDEVWLKVANALMVGIITDTDHCLSVDTTRRDFNAFQELSQFQDHDLIRKIIKFNRPMSWIKMRGIAINEAVIQDGIAVVGLGILPDEHRDVIADIASDMLTWSNVQTAVVFGLFEDRIEGSFRANNEATEVHTLCAKLGGKHGSGGGKLCKGAYKKPLASMSIDEDDEESLKTEMWDVIKRREINKIFRILKK